MDVLNKITNLIRCKKIKKNKINLFVLKVNKLGQLCESAPCFHCTKELAQNKFIQIDKLFFSRSDETITCVKFDKWVSMGTCHVSKGWKWLEKINLGIL